MKIEAPAVIAPESLRPHFSLVRRTEDFVFVSGQLPFGADQRVIAGDVADHTRQCLHNIEVALAGEGLGLADVVKTTVWLARVADFERFNSAYAGVFAGCTAPARSTVRADLVVEGALVEIEALAARRKAA